MLKKVLFISAFSLSSGLAVACPRTEQQFICPGDPVVDSAGNAGTVAAINPFQKTVAVNYGGSSDGQFAIQNVFLGLGCFEGYCVGDFAVDSNGNSGKISAVNPYEGQVAVNYGGSASGLFTVGNVALGLGCMEGYCVGDSVVDTNGNPGTLVALNFHNGEVAINYGGSANGLYKIETVSSTLYCSTYGDSDRSVPQFPVFDADLYVSPDFHFSLNRPVQQ